MFIFEKGGFCEAKSTFLSKSNIKTIRMNWKLVFLIYQHL